MNGSSNTYCLNFRWESQSRCEAMRDAAMGHGGAAAARTAALACMCTSCLRGRAHSLAAVGGARAYTLRRWCCVWCALCLTLRSLTRVCFAHPLLRIAWHTDSTFSSKAWFGGTCITHTRRAAQDDVIRDAAMGHGAAAARTAALACTCTSCLRGRARACGGRGGGACVYAAAVLLRVAH